MTGELQALVDIIRRAVWSRVQGRPELVDLLPLACGLAVEQVGRKIIENRDSLTVAGETPGGAIVDACDNPEGVAVKEGVARKAWVLPRGLSEGPVPPPEPFLHKNDLNCGQQQQ